eukprot:m.40216 g.40216  ORF g.40216 m.40216 type:complete len:346 (+) comp10284_c0_seq1:150-1187(+)
MKSAFIPLSLFVVGSIVYFVFQSLNPSPIVKQSASLFSIESDDEFKDESPRITAPTARTTPTRKPQKLIPTTTTSRPKPTTKRDAKAVPKLPTDSPLLPGPFTTVPPTPPARTDAPNPEDVDTQESEDPAATQLPTTSPDLTALLGNNNGLPLPWMQPEEIEAILKLLNKNTSYLEWGSGGSTWTYALRTGHAVSFEHNVEWCADVKKKLRKLKASHVTLHCVGVAKGYRGWAGGFTEGTYDQFEAYVNKVRKLPIEDHSIDVILDDGRARVPVALTALQYLKPNGTLIIHDFSWRPYYHVVLKYYTIQAMVSSLVLLRPRPGIVLTKAEIRKASPTVFPRAKRT